MPAAKIPRVLLVSLLLLVVCVSTTACSAEKRTAAKLHGTWYEDLTGQPYQFISDTQLVLPTALSNGSNAVTYSVIGSDKISLTQGELIHVIDITTLNKTELDTHDAVATTNQRYFRNLEDTTWAKNRATVANGALPALRRFPSISPKPDIVWVSAEPTDTADVWKRWPTSSIQRYAKAWDWTGISRNNAAALVTSGTADTEGYAIDFNRSLPTTEQISAYESATGQRVDAGSPHIAVGYSDSMKQYPEGSFIYLNGQLLYSLGEGYAINVRVGPTEADGFAPGTHP